MKNSVSTLHVSTSGDDRGCGSADAPLRTLGEAARRLRDGDRLLLRRGDIFRESVKISAREVEVTAYGPEEADLPVICGSLPVSGWRKHEGAIHVADLDTPIGYLYVNGEAMTIARFPNKGWLRTRSWEEMNSVRRHVSQGPSDRDRPGGGPTRIVCPELRDHPRERNDYWVGATVRWRHHSWWYETRPVIGCDIDQGELTLGDVSDWDTGPFSWDERGWGFFLDGKRGELDAPGEWFFDRDKGKIYLWMPDGSDPNLVRVEASVLTTGLAVCDSVVRDITFRHQQDVGLRIDGRCIVEGCRFEKIGRDAYPSEQDAGGAALRADRGTRGSHVRGNQFSGNHNLGITWHEETSARSGSVIEGNRLTDTGVRAGYGGSGIWHAVPIRIHSGCGVRVQGNVVRRSGYSGILILTPHNTADRNVIVSPMMTTNDGAGIMTNASHSTFSRNVVVDSKGEMESSGTWRNLAQGLWLDCYPLDNGEHLVEGNLAVGCGCAGLFVRRNHESLIRDNVFCDNGVQVIADGSGNRIFHNSLVAAREGQALIRFVTENGFGVLKHNRMAAADSRPFTRAKENLIISFEEWRERCDWSDATVERLVPVPAGEPTVLVNDRDEPLEFPLDGGFCDLNGTPVHGPLMLPALSAVVLFQTRES